LKYLFSSASNARIRTNLFLMVSSRQKENPSGLT